MKILITLYPFMDPGGITNNIENLGYALKAAGHRVDFVCLEWKERIGAVTEIVRDEVGVFGYQLNQRYGWHFPAKMRIPYKGRDNMKRWQDTASRYDLIIWEVPVPPTNRENYGNADWPKLYDLPGVRQHIVTHDGNIMANAHILEVIKHINGGLSTPHVCGYEQAAKLGINRCVTGSPQNAEGMPDLKLGYYAKRPRQWLSVQTWKRWKRVDDIVRAVPHMRKDTSKVLAGGGIEYFYMTSKTKVKPAYKDSNGRPIWDTAVKHGLSYVGWLSNIKRDQILMASRVLIDASYSRKYAADGDHYNRVAFEAVRCGAVPMMRDLVAPADGDWWRDGENCVSIPWDAEPAYFAELVEYALDLPSSAAELYVENGRDLLRAIDRHEAAKHILNMAMGRTLTGARGYCAHGTGRPDAALVNEHRRIMATHFYNKG